MAAAHVRQLNEPQPARVQLGADGRPSMVGWRHGAPGRGLTSAATSRGRTSAAASRRGDPRSRGHTVTMERVECVLDTWCVDDLWWTDRPLRRIYHEVQLTSGMRLIISWDMVEECWHVQR